MCYILFFKLYLETKITSHILPNLLTLLKENYFSKFMGVPPLLNLIKLKINKFHLKIFNFNRP